jgi:hypothetical protein
MLSLSHIPFSQFTLSPLSRTSPHSLMFTHVNTPHNLSSLSHEYTWYNASHTSQCLLSLSLSHAHMLRTSHILSSLTFTHVNTPHNLSPLSLMNTPDPMPRPHLLISPLSHADICYKPLTLSLLSHIHIHSKGQQGWQQENDITTHQWITTNNQEKLHTRTTAMNMDIWHSQQ